MALISTTLVALLVAPTSVPPRHTIRESRSDFSNFEFLWRLAFQNWFTTAAVILAIAVLCSLIYAVLKQL